MKNKRRILSYIWTALLFGFTVFATLDSFVLQHAYAVVEETAPTEQVNVTDTEPASETVVPETPTATAVQTAAVTSTPESTAVPAEEAQVVSMENSYSDGNVTITIQEIRAYDSTVYVADVVLSSPDYLKTAFANSTYGRNVTAKTSSIAETANAILAVNGDYYGTQESGYVIRNGVIYRDSAKRGTDVLCVYADGTMEVVSGEEKTAQELLESGVWQAFSFGPALLQTGEIAVSETEEVGKAMASNPRTAIGMIAPLHYVLVVSDGRTEESQGLSLYQLAEFMQSLGITTAYNLDGGGSSTMVFEGELVNKPTSGGSSIKERSVSDIVYIG